MANWDSSCFARLAKLGALPHVEEALCATFAELESLGVSRGEPAENATHTQGQSESISLCFPEGLEEPSRSFVEDLLRGLSLRLASVRDRDQARERAEMLSHASFEGLLLHRNGDVFDVNDRLTEVVGLPREALLGPTTINRCVTPEDVPFVLEKMRSGFEGSYVITAIRGDGTRFRAELQSKQGKLGEEPIRVAAVRDVTERERVWELLRESEKQLRALVDTVFDVTVLSQDGRVIDVSGEPGAMIGYSREEIVGNQVWKFVAPETQAAAEQLVARSTTGSYQTILTAKNGERVPVEIVAANTTLRGEPVRLAGVRDLRSKKEQENQREQLRRQVERAQRLDSLGALAGGVAHDFNNLLVGIMGNAELLLEELKSPEHRSFTSTILEASHRARELTGRLLAYSGRTHLREPLPIDLEALFRELDRLTAVSRSRHIKFSFDFEEGCIVLGDQASITQVMLNLITNAIEAIDEGPGTVVVTGRRIHQPDERWDEALGASVGPGDYVQVEVRDSGSGMDQDTALRAFEPFFTTKPRGHGLGLAASLGILKAHAGAVHVRSRPGEGATFAVLLPSAETSPSQKLPTKKVEGSSRLILIVDDQPTVRQHIVRVLKRRGYSLVEADSATSCFDQVETKQPDLILMDMTMPGVTGAETAAELRRRGITTPIVLTSGYVPEHQRDTFERDLFQGFLQKPYSLLELDSAIERALSLR
jgi:two-component system cell cycle sensor histidine kinase/response regulator CckA